MLIFCVHACEMLPLLQNGATRLIVKLLTCLCAKQYLYYRGSFVPTPFRQVVKAFKRGENASLSLAASC